MAEPEIKDTEERLRRTEELLRLILERISAVDPSMRLGFGRSLEQGLLSNRYLSPRYDASPDKRDFKLALGSPDADYFLRRLQSVEDAVAALAIENRDLRSANAALELRLEASERSSGRFAHELTSLLVQLSRAPQLDGLRFHRVIPVSIYLGRTDPEEGRSIQQQIIRILQEQGFVSLAEEPDVFSSWFKRLFSTTKDVVASDQFQGRLKKVEEAIELKNIDVVKAERDKHHSEAVLNISKALKGQSKGVVIIGSLLYVKRTVKGEGQVFSRTLTREQQDFLEMQPELQMDPEGIYEAFFRVKSDTAPRISQSHHLRRKLNLGDGE